MSIAFCEISKGLQILTAGHDGKVVLWVIKGQKLGMLWYREEFRDPPVMMDVRRDSSLLLPASRNGVIRMSKTAQKENHVEAVPAGGGC